MRTFRSFSTSLKMGYTLVTETAPLQPELATPYLKLYTAPTPNGKKITSLLELLGLDYYVYNVAISAKETKEPYYEKFNVNGKIPSLTYVDENKKVHHINESAAIMTFLCDKYDTERKFSYGPDSKYYYESLEWTYWQMAALGPMGGQAAFFKKFSEEKSQLAIDRFTTEVTRLFNALNKRLQSQAEKGSKFIVGDHISTADLVSYSWIVALGQVLPEDYSLDKYPAIESWRENLSKIPEIEKGESIPEGFASK